MCLQERKVAPPNVPGLHFYRPLGELFAKVSVGEPFIPVTPEDIKAAADRPATPSAAPSTEVRVVPMASLKS